jgi:nitrate/nitrite transport system ATP-binding protein
MAFLELEAVSKGYGRGGARTEVLRDIQLEVAEGEFVAIVGFSGSGKTTLVSLIAGLIAPDSGQIRVAGRRVTGPSPERGVVFQNYSLLPWLSVHGNVMLAVRKLRAGASRAEQHAIADRYIDMVGLLPAREKRPRELSGGMRQRVALARGLAMDPKLLLLDEPLSALDALTRATLQEEIERIWERDRKTVVMITNDVDEAILLADRIVPLRPGPGATLGPAFPVNLARPRNRAAVNHDPEYKKIRSEVTQYLVRAGFRRGPRSRRSDLVLPALEPRDLDPRSKRVRTWRTW